MAPKLKLRRRPDRTGDLQAERVSGRWPKGVSGNPSGRKQGSRNKATLAAETLLHGEAEKITRKCVELALKGDSTALRLVMERLLPPAKDKPLKVELPDTGTVTAADQIISLVTAGEITPQQGQNLIDLIVKREGLMVVTELKERLEKLEERAWLLTN